MKVIIAGGSGFVGKALSDYFLKNGDDVYILSRQQKTNTNVKYIEWLNDYSKPEPFIEGADIFINLAGESINSGRWNKNRKSRILQSRLKATTELLSLIGRLNVKPKVLINASAIGYYGTSNTAIFTEESNSIGDDFLSKTVKQWESLAMKAEALGVRTVLCRFGIVLDKKGGALPKMALPYQLYAGGKLGKGNQWISWIHIEDVVHAINFVIHNESVTGPVNFISPNPVQMNEFGKILSQVLGRPHWIPTPETALKLLLGEMSILMLEGQKVLPRKLLENGFTFLFPTLEIALKNIYQK
ncbi:TIGR01777 family oxidoreductase [Bacillus sp. CGMCC 1.16607]|uniref:TIGR01777 family oxidoreductase n=1 Tax=Bacillus sp. CGMCC 1.16607 TaxID=3351842 RepID=UPI00362C1285